MHSVATSQDSLSSVREYLLVECGLDSSYLKSEQFEQKIREFCEETHLAIEQLIESLQVYSPKNYKERLLNLFLEKERKWFGNPKLWEDLENQFFEEIIKDKTDFRALCMGAGSGQLPYSMAMSLDDFIRKHSISSKLHIQAVDSSPNALFSAMVGRYPIKETLEYIPQKYRQEYIVQSDNACCIEDNLKSLVNFAEGNLQSNYEEYNGNDLVLIGFPIRRYTKPFRKNFYNQLIQTLRPGGMIFILQPGVGGEDVPIQYINGYAYIKKDKNQ